LLIFIDVCLIIVYNYHVKKCLIRNFFKKEKQHYV